MKNIALALTLLVSQAFAQPAPDPAFSTERLARIDRLLERYTDENKIAGAVALVLHDGKPVYERAVGWSDKEAGRRMTVNTVFRIASQTKAITSAAVLALVEEGKIGLKEPVGNFIPSFRKTMVAVKDGSGIIQEIGRAHV